MIILPPSHPIWWEGGHHSPLHVSAVQSGNFSGLVGSSVGQQPFREGLRVREQQPRFWSWTPHGDEITVRARAQIALGSMVSFWLIGRETDPRECAGSCIVELFGNAMLPRGSAELGSGVHALRDPDATEGFATTRRQSDPTVFHDYAVGWSRDEMVASIDGDPLRRCTQPPFYRMQLIMAIFAFPAPIPKEADPVVPTLEVDRVLWEPLDAPRYSIDVPSSAQDARVISAPVDNRIVHPVPWVQRGVTARRYTRSGIHAVDACPVHYWPRTY